MKYYDKYVYETQQKSYESPIKNHNYLDEPLLLGAAEVTKHWDLLNIAPFFPYIEWLRHDDFKQFDELQWNVFAIGAVEQMKKIASNSPSDTDTIIYCDFAHQDSIILLEVDKKLAYNTIAKKVPEHILKNFRLHTEQSFNRSFQLINDSFLQLPISLYLNRNDFLRHIIVKL